jgi:rare lipoprotein A
LKRIFLAAFGAALTVSGVLADELGVATYYHNPHHGGLIAAHRTLPFGTRVRVYNLDNGRSAVVTVVDRGPFARGRIIDVSTVAADALGMRQAGVARVRLELMQQPPGRFNCRHPRVFARPPTPSFLPRPQTC